MKKFVTAFSALAMTAAFLIPGASLAQKTTRPGQDSDEKVSQIVITLKNDSLPETEQIVIIRKNESVKDYTIEVKGDKVLLNGKDIENNNDDNVTVTRVKIPNFNIYAPVIPSMSWATAPNTAVLGVTTESVDNGLRIINVSKNSAAKKAGLEKDDIITKVNDVEVESPDELSQEIRKHKPDETISVTYLRNGKETTVKPKLGRSDQASVVGWGDNKNFEFNFDEDKLTHSLNELATIPKMYNRSFDGFVGGPKLGLLVQDTEDGKGVVVLEADEEGNASKAGIEEDDVILEVDGKVVNSADEIAKIMKDSKNLNSVKFRYKRDGKTNTTDVKIPRKLKTANL